MKTKNVVITNDETGDVLENHKMKLFSFDELSEEGKEKAIEDHRNSNFEFFWVDEWNDSLKEFCEIFPIACQEWGLDHGINYNMTCESEISELSGVRLFKYLQNNYSSIYNDEYPFTGYCGDESLLDPIRDFIKKPDDTDFEQLLYECLQSWLSAVKQDYEYQQSDEYISETLQENEYDFNESGKMI